ncbi:MAG: DUF6885 family protein [Iamia sp.]
MAVLTFLGADAVLAAQAASLPQPDQLCGPFAAHAALHAVLDHAQVPGMVRIAAASASAIWSHDVAGWRPAGAPLDRTGWDLLPTARDPEASGTDAAGLARGIAEVTGGAVAVVPVAGAGTDADPDAVAALLVGIAGSEVPIGVVANVATGALDPDRDWDVGHFVVLWAVDATDPEGGRVAVADSYREGGDPGEPAGCRWVPLARLADAIGDAPGRGLLLLVRADHASVATGLVTGAGLASTIWST